MTETGLQRAVIDAARGYGCKVYRINSGRVRVRSGWVHLAEVGTPDLLIALRGGSVLWVEVKLPGEAPTDIQLQRHEELRALGHRVAVVRSVDDLHQLFVDSPGDML